jgi:hypothetical protein
VTLQPRESGEVDALVTDGYLESLLAARDRRATDAPSVAELDPAVRYAATRLSDGITRVHPSFRFEERLAARLAEAAARMSLARAAGAEGAPPVSGAILGLDLGATASGPLDPLDLEDPARPEELAGIPRRPLIIGGTLASAISIAGAAIVAWRLNRSGHAGPDWLRPF